MASALKVIVVTVAVELSEYDQEPTGASVLPTKSG
jgi:hypothetical protein